MTMTVMPCDRVLGGRDLQHAGLVQLKLGYMHHFLHYKSNQAVALQCDTSQYAIRSRQRLRHRHASKLACNRHQVVCSAQNDCVWVGGMRATGAGTGRGRKGERRFRTASICALQPMPSCSCNLGAMINTFADNLLGTIAHSTPKLPDPVPLRHTCGKRHCSQIWS